MAVPPTSPLRVFPQAVNIDVQGFMPQGDLFQKSMAAFEQGSKLPLLQEQIKHEKKRLRLENAKLDFAASEAGQQQEAAARRAAELAAQEKLLGDIATRRKIEAEAARTRAETEGLTVVDRGVPLAVAAGGAPGPLAEVDVGGGAPGPLEKIDSVLPPPAADFSQTFGSRTIPLPSDYQVTPEVDPTVVDSPVYTPRFLQGRGIESLEVVALPGELGRRDATGYARQQALAKLEEEFPPFRGMRKDESKYNEDKRKRAIELNTQYQPKVTTVELLDSNKLPVSVPVMKVGDEVVDILGDPYINTDRLTKPQLARDEEFQKFIGSSDYLRQRVNRDANIEKLVNAAEYLIEAGDNWNPFDTRLAAIALPESVLKLFGSDRQKAKTAARTVLQQQLRETLGAQFAFKEGEMMLDRGFDLLFDDNANLGMLKEGAQSMLTLAREMDRATTYYTNNQTLAGFNFNSGLVTEHPVLTKFDRAMTAVGKTGATRGTPGASSGPTPEDVQKGVRLLIGGTGASR